MRFLSDGPIIPPELIEQRNKGNVIFFCGAGVSLPAGLPSFGGLTERTINRLGAEKAKQAFERQESFDRVFNALIREFGRPEIDHEIYNALKTPRKPKLDSHRLIIDLSRGPSGQPQLVTTNFDLLFECADRKAKVVVPPALPDLSLNQKIEGIVYLHGRLTRPDKNIAAGYVISSADFGRAYLAEGWAARFVKSLREQFTIVLLGYTANDPPMRYLLEGLHAREGTSYNAPIYAFTAGNAGDAEEEWQDRGVTPICYEPFDNGHSGLWETLALWAKAVREADVWNAEIIQLAQRRPSELTSCQRGQVANLVSTKAGAKLFADAEPRPPSEWLCVFDAATRYAKPRKRSYDGDEIDPLEIYGLDDDPPRPISDGNGQTIIPGKSMLDWKHDDASFPERITLRAWDASWTNPLPERLNHLARWFGTVSHEPVAVWWASGSRSLNPNMTWFVNRRMRDDFANFPEPACKFWNLYFDSQYHQHEMSRGGIEFGWYDFKEVLRDEGWSNYTLRLFERSTHPYVEFNRHGLGAPTPPEGDWKTLELSQVVEPKVRVLDRHGEALEIPDAYLASVVAILRQSLITAAELLDEVGTTYWRTPTLHPTGNPGGGYHGRKELSFVWFKDLFLDLLAKDPDAARFETTQWPQTDKYFFSKLCIYAAMHPALSKAKQVAQLLTGLSNDLFWEPYSERELLFTIRARWPEFSSHQRRAIERKIIAGPAKWKSESRGDYRNRRATSAASCLRWLELNGCALTSNSADKLDQLKKIDERWTDRWAASADESYEPRGGTIERVTELRGLDTLPINRIVSVALARTEDRFDVLKDFRPFEGMVKTFPFKSLAALRFSLKNGDFPVRFWQNLLSEWPDETPLRLRWLLASTIASLSHDHALELRYYLPRWLEKHLAALAKEDRRRALELFDAVLKPFLDAKAETTKSGIGHTSVGGVIQDRSEVSISKAINSPVGVLTEALWSLSPKKASAKRPLPRYIGNRLEALFSVQGDGGGHAACVMAQRMGWLEYCYPAWMKEVMLPLFSLSHPLSEAVWHGLAYDRNGLSGPTLKQLNEPFLALLRSEADWRLDTREYQHHVRRLVYLSRAKVGNKPIISFAQAHDVLVRLDDKARGDAVWALSDIITEKGAWAKFVKPFIENAWPRQVRFKSEATSSSFAHLLESAGEDFDDAVKTILPLLRPVANLHMITYRFTKDDGTDERNYARQHPEGTLAVLDALIAEDRSQRPYQLGKTLEMIGEAKPSLRQTTEWRRLNELVN